MIHWDWVATATVATPCVILAFVATSWVVEWLAARTVDRERERRERLYGRIP